MKNRWCEQNPVLSDKPVAAISRPVLRKFLELATGPVRGLFTAPGSFDEQLFAVGGQFLYRVSPIALTASTIGQISTNTVGAVSWAAVAPIGETPARLFIAEGEVLWVYSENAEARGQLQAAGAFSNGEVVRIDGVYYHITTGSVDASAPAGTAANPWRVQHSAIVATTLQNLFDAINDSGIPGTQYSTALTEHPTVRATAKSTADLYVTAKAYGTAGNAIVTTETCANASWGGGTLAGGGTEGLRQVALPNDVGAVSIAHINSYVIVVPVQDEALETIGRFYWINPGETYVDPLDFATAERSQDKLHQVGVFSDKFWLFGQVTTEPWITSGNPDAPMQRFQGILFDRGSWEGTAVQVKDSLVVVDEDGGVFQIAGGLARVSTPDVEERIRRAIQEQGI